MTLPISVDKERLADFCRRWNISEFALFGSVLRDDFGPESDVDVLVSFGPGGGISFDNRVQILEELEEMFGRKVDLVVKKNLRNPFRRRAILNSREILYAA
ncbi:MAG: nucleotidyltransferase family protein [Deltaproteobacteria bacterium]|nr:nucleotidyltransferase family protein [Deltaproteobacteria bacterium]